MPVKVINESIFTEPVFGRNALDMAVEFKKGVHDLENGLCIGIENSIKASI